jgi:dipeptidyl aminopeptidase/acylaminoacyl peptidase
VSAIHADQFGLGYLPLAGRTGAAELDAIEPVAITGTAHEGEGELTGLEHLAGDRYLLEYNIDGCSWLYAGRLDEPKRRFAIEQVVCGQEALASGVLHAVTHDEASDTQAFAFSTATSPSQLLTKSGQAKVIQHTRERLIGVRAEELAAGEDASFTSFDGLRISARLYRPAPVLGFQGPRPVVYYLHGGPQGQERPDFTWFSMPLIQFLTLRGCAVFTPNARGSTGYGLRFMKHVDRDWGGQDRLDHLHAMTEVLAKDRGLDVSRAGVVGRSYGGYMTLTLAARHPERWAAAVDMFGPYDLLTFTDRIPESWKPYFKLAVGDPTTDRDFLVERSPATYIEAIRCPLLVIQGKNDPRVIERESRDVVERLRALGKEVEYLVFEDEGHDVLKYANKVRCYNAIADFFATHLRP